MAYADPNRLSRPGGYRVSRRASEVCRAGFQGVTRRASKG